MLSPFILEKSKIKVTFEEIENSANFKTYYTVFTNMFCNNIIDTMI